MLKPEFPQEIEGDPFLTLEIMRKVVSQNNVSTGITSLSPTSIKTLVNLDKTPILWVPFRRTTFSEWAGSPTFNVREIWTLLYPGRQGLK